MHVREEFQIQKQTLRVVGWFNLPMGSRTSPVIADMKALEERALSTFELGKPNLWNRYVDDVFSITKKTHVPKLLQQSHRSWKTEAAPDTHLLKASCGFLCRIFFLLF